MFGVCRHLRAASSRTTSTVIRVVPTARFQAYRVSARKKLIYSQKTFRHYCSGVSTLSALEKKVSDYEATHEALNAGDISDVQDMTEFLPPFSEVESVAKQLLKQDNVPALCLRLGKYVFHNYISTPEEIALGGELISKAMEQDPTNAEAYYWGGVLVLNYTHSLGRALERIGEHDASLKSYNQSYALNPMPETNIAIGMLYSKTGDYRQAIRYFLEALTQEPESSSVMMNLGSAYLGCEKYEWFEMAMEKDPGNYEIIRAYGYCHAKMGDKDKALQILNGLLETHADYPQIPELHELIGDLYAESEQYTEAAEHYTEAQLMDPQNPNIYIKMGNISSVVTQDPEAAAAWFKKAIEVDPSNVTALNCLAAAYLSDSKEKDAIAVLQKALKLDPNSFETRMNYATLLNDKGEPKEALRMLNGLVPRDDQEAELLGQMLEIVHKTKALSINPADWD